MSIGIVAYHSKYKDLYGEKKLIVPVTYENERISIKNSLTYLKCVTSLLCGPRADLWPFMGFYVKGFLSTAVSI